MQVACCKMTFGCCMPFQAYVCVTIRAGVERGSFIERTASPPKIHDLVRMYFPANISDLTTRNIVRPGRHHAELQSGWKPTCMRSLRTTRPSTRASQQTPN